MVKKTITVNVRKPARKQKKQREPGILGQALRTLGGTAGGYAGGYLGNPALGSMMGTSLGAALSKWLGAGDYRVKSNSILRSSLNASSSIPMMHKDGQTITVRHKEYLGPVLSSINFNVQNSYSLNPGMNETFPWLADIAKKFQEFEFKGIVYQYIPTSGVAVSGTNPALGSVMLQTSYRATENAPTSKIEMLNEYWSSEASPAETFVHPIECSPDETILAKRYVRDAGLPATENKLFYDLGTTFLAVSGQQANGNAIGDLWVTYEVELRKPVVTSSSASSLSSAEYINLTPTQANLLGSATNYLGSSLGVSANTVTLPDGATGIFNATVVITGATAGATGMVGPPVFVNAAIFDISPGSNRIETNVASTVTGTYSINFLVPDPAKQATITFPGTWTFPGTPKLYLFINQIQKVI